MQGVLTQLSLKDAIAFVALMRLTAARLWLGRKEPSVQSLMQRSKTLA